MKKHLTGLLLVLFPLVLHASEPLKTYPPKTGFTENKGQFRDEYGKANPDVLFSKNFGGMKVQLRRDGFSYELYQVKPKWVDPATIPYKLVTYAENGDTSVTWPGQAEAMKNLMYHYQRVDVKLTGANLNLKILTEDSTGGTTGYLSPAKKGNNIEVAGFSAIRYNEVYPGIDMVCHANPAGGGFKYDFIVHPEGNPDHIQLEYQGCHQLALNGQGELEINTGMGVIKEKIPVSWYQDSNGEKEMINVSYSLEGSVLKFKAREKHNQTLIIDPAATLHWATYYGGSLEESGTCLAIDTHQNVYMGGSTSSTNNIATSGSYADSITLPYDGFIAKFTNDGQRLCYVIDTMPYPITEGSFSLVDTDRDNDIDLIAAGDIAGFGGWDIGMTYYYSNNNADFTLSRVDSTSYFLPSFDFADYDHDGDMMFAKHPTHHQIRPADYPRPLQTTPSPSPGSAPPTSKPRRWVSLTTFG